MLRENNDDPDAFFVRGLVYYHQGINDKGTWEFFSFATLFMSFLYFCLHFPVFLHLF